MRIDRRTNYGLGRSDIWLAAAVFGASLLAAAFFFRHWPPVKSYWRPQLTPAISLACGAGFLDLRTPLPVVLRDFLQSERNDFNCAEISDWVNATKPIGTDLVGHLILPQRYLYETIGYYWKWRGVSWSAVNELAGILFAFTNALAYFLFRIGMGRALAMVASVLYLSSPFQLSGISNIRDYGKTPFLVLSILLIGLICTTITRPRRFLLACVALGTGIGVGVGFRGDLFVMLPLVISVIPLFAKVSAMRLRIAGLLAALSFFFLFSYPIRAHVAKGSNHFHAFLVGFSNVYDDDFGVRPAFYRWSR